MLLKEVRDTEYLTTLVFNQWSQVQDYQYKFQNMNDYLEKQDNRNRNNKYRASLDQMTEYKRSQQNVEKDRERLIMMEKMKEQERLNQLEYEEKMRLRRRNNEILDATKMEQEMMAGRAHEAKMKNDEEFRRKIELMKQQEQISKRKEKEFKDIMVKDMQENCEIQKKVRFQFTNNSLNISEVIEKKSLIRFLLRMREM